MNTVSNAVDRCRFWASCLNQDIVTGYFVLPRRPIGSVAEALDAAIAWICRAQDASPDGGVARSYSLVYNTYFGRQGWIASYPETTGYIIPTMFDYARLTAREDIFRRAVRMADWECDVQLPSGAVQGGTVDQPASPAVFNTGQVIFGWVRAFLETQNERYLQAAARAGRFLAECQDAAGAWRAHLTAHATDRISSYTYNVRTAWALQVLGSASGDETCRVAAVRNVEFALGEQIENGWFANNCLYDADRPLVHTIAYALEGILEIGIALDEPRYIDAARRASDALLARQRPDGSLAGRYDREWRPTVDYSCLTGNAQMALVWGRLYQITNDRRYREAQARANRFLQRVQWRGTGNPGLDGGISGSFPLHGRYGRFEVLNWAAKFFADSLMLEAEIQGAIEYETEHEVMADTSARDVRMPS